jgi:hypothetical protein
LTRGERLDYLFATRARGPSDSRRARVHPRVRRGYLGVAGGDAARARMRGSCTHDRGDVTCERIRSGSLSLKQGSRSLQFWTDAQGFFATPVSSYVTLHPLCESVTMAVPFKVVALTVR